MRDSNAMTFNAKRLGSGLIAVVPWLMMPFAYANDLRLVDGSLVMRIPDGWVVEQRKQGEQTELTVLSIPVPPSAGSTAPANVVIISQPNRLKLGPQALAASEIARSRSSDPEYELQQLEEESPVWTVALATSRDGPASYVLYDHFGATPKTLASIRVVLPITQTAAGEWESSTLDAVGSFIDSISMDKMGTGKWRLRRNGAAWFLVPAQD